MGNVTVYGTTIMDKFPDCGQFFNLPEEPISVRIRRADLAGALRRAGVYTQRSEPTVALTVNGQQLNISASDIDFNKGFSEDHSIEHSGPDIRIGFTNGKLADLIAAFEDEEVSLQLTADNKLVRIKSENRMVEAILMPAMIR